MRQAGRSLPEYHATRGESTLLDAVAHPEMAAELTLQPVRRYGVDAAILFSDIMVPLWAIGFGVDIVPGVGPVVERAFRSRADLKRLRGLEPDDIPFLEETVQGIKSELDIPLIGFGGAPFTLAGYLIEGRPSTRLHMTKKLMLTCEALWFNLMDRLASLVIASLEAQVSAGVDALQIFDSWGGVLGPDHYRRYAFPAHRRVLEAVRAMGVPSILFGLGAGHLLEQFAEMADVVGIDWRIPLEEARRKLGPGVAVQGNLDPSVCLAPWETVEHCARAIIRQNAARRGFIFNLGHGVLPETDPANLERLVEFVHRETENPDRMEDVR